MEYKEKPEGPFIVTFFVNNFSASDSSYSYQIKLIDLYGNTCESNILNKSDCSQVNFPSNSFEIHTENAINDVVEHSIRVEVFALNPTSENEFFLVGSEQIKLFPFLHDQLIVVHKISMCYKNDNSNEDLSKSMDSEKKKKKKTKEKEKEKEKEDKKKKKLKNSKNELDRSENEMKMDIIANFLISLNINSLIGNYADRDSYNIMIIKAEGVHNISSHIEEKLSKKNSLSFQLKFLDTCLNDGIISEADSSNNPCIMWSEHIAYKYRNRKETEYIYNFLLNGSFSINGYLFCFNEQKKHRNEKNMVKSLSAKVEIPVQDIITNQVNQQKYPLQKIEVESKEDTPFVYSDAYLMLSVEFFKPLVTGRRSLEIPIKTNYLDTIRKIEQDTGTEETGKEKESISDLFNRSIQEGIEFINEEINKLKSVDQVKIYQKSQEYVNFLNNLKDQAKYITVYNNIKKVMIKLAYEIVNKRIYKNYNTHKCIYMENEQEEEEEIEEENKKHTKAENEKEKKESTFDTDKDKQMGETLSEENANCILVNLFNCVHESSNIIINNYFEKYENLNKQVIEEIKENNSIYKIKQYIHNIIIENEFLLKYKKNESLCEVILLIIFKQIEARYIKIKQEEEINQNNNHLINIIENCEDTKKSFDENEFEELQYSYKKKNKDKGKFEREDNVTSLINSIYSKNRNYCYSYLFEYIEEFSQTFIDETKNKKRNEHETKDEEVLNETNQQKDQEENEKEKENKTDVLDILNLDEFKDNKEIFLETLYRYCTILLMKNNSFHKVTEEYVSPEGDNSEETRISENKNTFIDNLEKNEEDRLSDDYTHYSNFDFYEKYIRYNLLETCILCLSTYIQLTNFNHVESIFFLSLLYLNTHRYEEAHNLLCFLIQFMQRNNSRDNNETNDKEEEEEEEEEIRIDLLYLYNSLHRKDPLQINEQLCTFVLALSFFFQGNYVQYYSYMCRIMQKSENELKREIEQNTLEKKQKKKPMNNENSDKKEEEEEEEEEEKEKNKNINENEKGEKDEKEKEEAKKELFEENKSSHKKIPSEKRRKEKDKDKEKEKENNTEQDEILITLDEIKQQYKDINIENIPLKDKYMLWFLIYCVKFQILNIVMYIHENQTKFLTSMSIKTNLYKQLIIKTYFTMKDFSYCKKLIEEEPESISSNLDILYMYGESLYKLKKYDRAIEYFKNYLNLSKYNNLCARINLHLCKLYAYMKQYEESKESVKKSLKIYKSSYAYFLLSNYYLKKKKYVATYKLLFRCNEMNSFNHKAWALLTIVFLHLNMKDQADKSLNNFLKMKRYDKDIILELIAVHKKYGYDQEANDLYELTKGKK